MSFNFIYFTHQVIHDGWLYSVIYGYSLQFIPPFRLFMISLHYFTHQVIHDGYSVINGYSLHLFRTSGYSMVGTLLFMVILFLYFTHEVIHAGYSLSWFFCHLI